MDEAPHHPFRVVVVGGGPAGLMAAGTIASAADRGRVAVSVHDRMPSFGRKLLMAGRGGLNITHSEPLADFLGRYGAARPALDAAIRAFDPQALRAWCAGLGQETFVGSSGRVFPTAMKASPLLRAWLGRLRGLGVDLVAGSRWAGWDREGRPLFSRHGGPAAAVEADALVLAMGGASWPRLGSDGMWADLLAGRGIAVSPLVAANAGVEVSWSAAFRDRFAGQPVKAAAFSHAGRAVRAEAVVTAYGLEGGAVYALSSALRESLDEQGVAELVLDLKPDWNEGHLARRLERIPSRQSLSSGLRKAANLSPVSVALLREDPSGPPSRDPAALAARIKAVRIRVTGMRPIERAISSAGGIALAELDADFMIRRMPGVFAAGEMLDWEAPTGGYLLQACLATGRAAGLGVLDRLGLAAHEASDAPALASPERVS